LASTRCPVSAESYEDYLKGRYYWKRDRKKDSIRPFITSTRDQKDPHYSPRVCRIADWLQYHRVGNRGNRSFLRSGSQGQSGGTEGANWTIPSPKLRRLWRPYDLITTGLGRPPQLDSGAAIELNPSYATAYQRYSLYLMATGRHAGKPHADESRTRPRSMSISMNFSLGWRLYMAPQ